jgi:macrodomain Ter protein organizer (MatP/YcbG family)
MVEIRVIVVRARGNQEAERITEYRVRRTEERQVQRCKSEQSSCAKVQKWRQGRLQSAEDVSYEDRANVQMGAELRCKGGKVNDKTGRGVAEAEEITEYRVQSTEERQVQRCKSEQSSCAKVQRWRRGRLQSTEFRVRSTELKGMR